MKEIKFNPIGNILILEEVKKPQQTTGGVFLPSMGQDITKFGKVIAKGPGVINQFNNELMPMQAQLNDIVGIPNFGGQRMIINDIEYIAIRENDVLTIIENFNS